MRYQLPWAVSRTKNLAGAPVGPAGDDDGNPHRDPHDRGGGVFHLAAGAHTPSPSSRFETIPRPPSLPRQAILAAAIRLVGARRAGGHAVRLPVSRLRTL